MTAADLLAEVHSHGGRLLLNGDRLSWEAPADLPADLLDRLRAHKAEVMRLLRERPDLAGKPITDASWPPDVARLLARVSCAFRWQQADVNDLMAWARRCPGALADARVFLEHEVAKLPAICTAASCMAPKQDGTS